jgi:DNA adenine methylase
VIREHIPPGIHTYYEPFVGAGAVFLALRPPRAVINDRNSQLILAYKIIRERVEELIALLRRHAERNSKDYYYAVRNMDRDADAFKGLTETEKAARLIFLNKTCYNGLYRVNSRGHFNVPRGAYKNPAICEEALLRRISEYLNSNDISIMNADYEGAVAGAGSDSFVYFDPPYHSPGNTNFTGYQAGGFGEDEQRRLRDVYLALTGRGVKCLLSNSDTEFIRALYHYKFLNIVPVRAKRFINADPSGRGSVYELLIKNW